MDLKGSLVDTNLKIYPSEKLINFIKSIPIDSSIPENILKFNKTKKDLELPKKKNEHKDNIQVPVQFSNKDIENLKKIANEVDKLNVDKRPVKVIENELEAKTEVSSETNEKEKSTDVTRENLTEKCNGHKYPAVEDELKTNVLKPSKTSENKTSIDATTEESKQEEMLVTRGGPYLFTSDIDWLYHHIQKRQKSEKDVPYLHELFEGTTIDMPENKIIKRNPILEARCKKLRAQQDARAYRKMTKSVDNVRMRFPEDSIAYQLKQVNRQLIAIFQFILSIFAGFLFGFKGVDWMIGDLDFGFRLLLGVMCALVIALAEIYFLAKKLNEELNIPETTQLGGPPKFVDTKQYPTAQHTPTEGTKEHKD